MTEEALPVDVTLVTAADLAPIAGPQRVGTLLALKFTLNGGNGTLRPPAQITRSDHPLSPPAQTTRSAHPAYPLSCMSQC